MSEERGTIVLNPLVKLSSPYRPSSFASSPFDSSWLIRPLHILLEPGEDAGQAVGAVPGLAADGVVVALVGVAHELNRHARALEDDEGLLRLLHRAAQIHLAVDDQRRRRGAVHVGDRRAAHVGLQVLARRLAAELPGTEGLPDVAGAPEGDEVADDPLGHDRFEAVGMAEEPAGHVA